jgi:hypothetical protein
MSDTIRCPQCAVEIEVTEVLAAQLRTQVRQELEAGHRDKEAALSKREAEYKQRETSLAQQKLDLAKAKEEIDGRVDQQVAARLAIEQKRIAETAQAKAREQFALELQGKDLALKDKEEQLADAARRLKAATEAELTLRKERRELDQEREQLELTLARRLDEERAKTLDAAKRDAAAEWQLKVAEFEKRNSDLLKQLEEARRKAEQGSQQLQGEVLELSLESSLRQTFPFDEITPVPKGVHGGDVVQTVRDPAGNECGNILWESKRTKTWSDGWLPKLRDDQRAAKAQVAILASTQLPKGVTSFQCLDGVWVTSMPCAVNVAAVLRTWLIEVAAVKRLQACKHDTTEALHSYICGPEFRHRFEGVLESFVTMQTELDQERRALQRAWAKREKQLERGIAQAITLHGDLAGIVGGALPTIASVELPGLPGPGEEGNGEVTGEQGELFGAATVEVDAAPLTKRRIVRESSVERQ